MNELEHERPLARQAERQAEDRPAPHKAQGPKERFRVRGPQDAPTPNLEVDATDEQNAKDQWVATNGAGFEGADLRVDRIEASSPRPVPRGGRR